MVENCILYEQVQNVVCFLALLSFPPFWPVHLIGIMHF